MVSIKTCLFSICTINSVKRTGLLLNSIHGQIRRMLLQATYRMRTKQPSPHLKEGSQYPLHAKPF